jgi:hypothetical protein
LTRHTERNKENQAPGSQAREHRAVAVRFGFPVSRRNFRYHAHAAQQEQKNPE